MTTLKQINDTRNLLMREREATLSKLTSAEFPNPNIVNALRRAIDEYYRPRLELLDFKFEFIQNMKIEQEAIK